MRLELKHWLVLHALHHHPTVYAAADSLSISQSALSHRLAEAERRLDIALFERDGRRLKITPAGESLTQTALQILPLLERAEADARDWAKDTQHLVRIGIASYNHFAWLGEFIHHLNQVLPTVQLELVASANQHPSTSLLESQVDLVLAPGEFDHRGLCVTPLFQDELVLLTHPHHQLATKAYISPADLEFESYFSYSRDSLPGFEYERFIRPSGVIPRLTKLVEMPDAIIELINANLGTSILSRWANAAAINAGKVIAIPLGNKGLSLQWSCLTRSNETRHSTVKQVEQRLQAWFTQHKNLDMSPRRYAQPGTGEQISYAFAHTHFGLLAMAATDKGVCFVQFGASKAALIEQLKAEFPQANIQPSSQNTSPVLAAWTRALSDYLNQQGPKPDLPLDMRGTAFQTQVWKYLLSIKDNNRVSYADVANSIGKPSAHRAVANACGKNSIAILVPCHLVLRSDGSAGGYRWGSEKKQALLEANL